MDWQRRRQELIELSAKYAEAEAKRTYLSEFRKSKKAILMKSAELDGVTTAAGQERSAYANNKYIEVIESLQAATEEAVRLKWELEIAKMGLSVWQTKEATARAEMGMR